MTDLFGYEWCSLISVETPVVLPDGETSLGLTFAYSKDDAQGRGDSEHPRHSVDPGSPSPVSTIWGTGLTTSRLTPIA
jgi:hypothetical protein